MRTRRARQHPHRPAHRTRRLPRPRPNAGLTGALVLLDRQRPRTHPPGRVRWVRWDRERARLLPLPWCPARAPRNADDACGLFAGHPSGHSWAVTDPADEAITWDLARRHPHLFR
nr:hypothetical protein [Streptomyces sp. b62]